MEAKVNRLISEWLGKSVNGWQLDEYVNAGKSALVFRGHRGEQVAAIKVFDPEIIERFGSQDTEERIQRELSLVGLAHPNLVGILDGGFSRDHGLFFVAMDFVEAPNLATVLRDVPAERVPGIISQAAHAAEFLEQHGLVHRDIKPDNIAILPDFKTTVLLDLGVVRPLGERHDPTTDRERKVFVGTLQYSPPEFLLREEEQSVEGYRAITFYQLGGVLYDLLTGGRLFEGSTDPYAKLVNAVLYEIPHVDSDRGNPQLVSLCRNCLVKPWRTRLQIVSWADFHPRAGDVDPAAAAKEEIRKRRALAAYETGEEEGRLGWDALRQRQQALARLLSQLAEVVRAVCNEGALPPRTVKLVPGDNGERGDVGVSFSRWPSFGLQVPVALTLRLEVLDRESPVVSVDLAAAAAAESVPDTEQWTSVFRGVYDDSVLRPALAKALLPVIARAMDVPAGQGEPVRLTKPDPMNC